METGNYQKQRGFLKSKLAKTFSRGFMKRSWPGQCSSTTTTSSCKVRPSPSSARNGSGSGSVSYLSVHQDLQNSSSSMQKVAPLSTAKPTSYGYFDYGHGGGGDENVDMKATDFIVYVRERFQQERPVNSNAF